MESFLNSSRILTIFFTGLLFVLSFLSTSLSAQNQPRIRARFLDTINSPRSLALGKATVALSGYSGALQLNPATIGTKGDLRFTRNISWMDGDRLRLRRPGQIRGQWNSTTTISYQADKFSLTAFFHSANRINSLTANALDYKHQALGLSGAYMLSGNTRIGGGIKYIYLSDEDDVGTGTRYRTAKNFALDLGLYHSRTFHTDNFSISPSLGWSLANLGPTFSYAPYGENEIKFRYSLPMKMRFGLALKTALQKEWHRRPYVSVSLVGGLSKELARADHREVPPEPYGPIRALIHSWGPLRTINGKSFPLGQQIKMHGGVELSLLDIFYGRLGYIKNPDRFTINIPSRGVGLDLYFVSIDYAWIKVSEAESFPFNTFRRDNTIWKITGKIPLGKENDRNFWPHLFNKLGHLVPVGVISH